MSKKLFYIIPLLFLCIFSGCKEEKHFKIGVSQCSSDDWRNKMNEEIYQEIMFHPEAEVEIRSGDDDNDKQIADIKYFADNGFDIIIVAPNEEKAITPIIKKVYESGIPVIVFDREIIGDTYTVTRGVDNYEIGKAAAQYAYNLIGNNGKVIEIMGLEGSSPATQRHSGFNDEASELGLSVVAADYGSWNYEDAVPVANTLLSKHPEANLIYAHNDRMAIAASQVAKKKGLSLKVIGIDAAPEIGVKAVADGVIDATFLYPTDGYGLIRTAMAILKGTPYQKETKLPIASAVDSSNADMLLLQNESLKEENEKIKLLKSQIDDYWDRHSAQTTLFYAAIAIVILLFGFLFMVLRSFWLHKRHQKVLVEQNKLLEQQRDTEMRLNEQLNLATQSKLIFFTNVSHDLRTPLTLIAEPVEQLEAADNLTPQQHNLMKIANKNVKILRRLINQILDFRKYENGKLNVNLSEVHIVDLMKDWMESFTAIAKKRDIKLSIEIQGDTSVTLAIDVEKIERVFFNLMSNAFKYSPDNSKINFVCRCDDEFLTFSVEDTGKGISEEEIANIFNRFYQVDKIHPNGSGIGLSLAKAFVELHEGTIGVESVLGKGSKFTVKIPVKHVDNTTEENIPQHITDSDVLTELSEIELNIDENKNDLPLLLVIDDNGDIRKLIRELLSDEYHIIEAVNGKEGIKAASKYVPDLIICDVMMPVMDGLECCRRIKNEISTSHIPILMLTACSMDEQRIQGYESGADSYLSKPFNSRMLRMRCENLIENRKRIKNVFSPESENVIESINSRPTHQENGNPNGDIDDEFYNRFITLLRKEMSNPELSIDSLASKLNIGRSQFYRKIKALTNYSPVELLRKVRLTKARDLLSTTNKPVSEIAYEVGFSAPAYFTKVFREMFDESPTELRTRLGIKD